MLVKNRGNTTKSPSYSRTIARLTQSAIIASAAASNRMAGNRLTNEEVEALYKNILMKTKDNQEVKKSDTEYLLSPKQLSLWQWAVQNGSFEFSRKDAVEALGFPERTVESIIKKLVAMKRLQRLGEGKATRYKVTQ